MHLVGQDAGGSYALSHGELMDRSRALARELRLRSPEIVAVCLQRTPALVVALLGVLFAGAAYLPLEPTHPGARLRFLLEDSQATCLAPWPREGPPAGCAGDVLVRTAPQLAEGGAAGADHGDRRRGDGTSERPGAGKLMGASEAPPELPEPTDPERPMYLMRLGVGGAAGALRYTSGSTGTPKGRGLRPSCHAGQASWCHAVGWCLSASGGRRPIEFTLPCPVLCMWVGHGGPKECAARL